MLTTIRQRTLRLLVSSYATVERRGEDETLNSLPLEAFAHNGQPPDTIFKAVPGLHVQSLRQSY